MHGNVANCKSKDFKELVLTIRELSGFKDKSRIILISILIILLDGNGRCFLFLFFLKFRDLVS